MSRYYKRDELRRVGVTVRPDQVALVHVLIREYEPCSPSLRPLTTANNRPHTLTTEDGMVNMWFYVFPEREAAFKAAVAALP